MRRPLISAALAAALALSLAACADSTGTKDSASGASASAGAVRESAAPADAKLTLASFIADTSAAFTAAGSYKFTLTSTMSGQTTGASGTIVGSTAGSLSMSVTTDTGGGGSVTIIMADGGTYMDGTMAGEPGKWIDLGTSTNPALAGLADEMKKSADPAATLSKLSSTAGTIVRGETSTIDGTKVTAYTLSVDMTDMLAAMGQAGASTDALAAAGATGMVETVYYVDAKGRPVKSVTTLGTTLSQEATYSGFGEQEPVKAPEASTIIPASAIGM